jgi:hypothetical protein
VSEITTKAAGVFLWVMLLVKSLLDGLRNYDTIDELRHRLEELPADLEDLYRHMLYRMSPAYRHQASRMLQLVIRSFQVQEKFPLNLVQLSFADGDNPRSAITAEIRPRFQTNH